MPTKVKTMTGAERLSKASQAQREAWEANRYEEALAREWARAERLERRAEGHRDKLEELEAWQAELQTMRAGFVEELEGLPEDTRDLTGQEESRIRSRRNDLRDAVVALDGHYAQGTLVDHLWDKPRIAGTRRRIAEERELLDKTEGELRKVRRQLGD